MQKRYNNLWLGAIIGLIVPFVGYAILMMILEQLGSVNSLAEKGLNFDFRTRTMGLLAIAMNIIPMQIFKKDRANEGIRGLVITTMIYAVIWVYYFGLAFLS